MASREGNKGNLQYIAGEVITAWATTNILTPGDSEINDKAAHTLEAVAYAKTRGDTAFWKEFEALDTPHIGRAELRYKQIRLMIWKLADCGILRDKAIPFFEDQEGEDE